MAHTMKKTWLLLMFPAIYLLLPGCSDSTGKNSNKELHRVQVKTAKPAISSPKNYIGTVEASVSVLLSFQVTGTVEQVLASEGQRVTRGQLLASIDDRGYRDACSIAKAKEKQAEDALQRLSELYHKGSLPEIKYIEVESGVSQTRSAASLAQKNVSDCKLIAPLDGVIGKRSIEPGENAIPFQSVFILVNTDQLDVKVSVPEKEISGIATGDHAFITIPALDNARFQGDVLRKGVVAQPISHTYNVMIRLHDKDSRLLPGMVCRVDFQTEKNGGSAMIPVQVIQTDGNGRRYILIPDETEKKVRRREVITGDLVGLNIVITDGLVPGEPYISEGYQHLDTTMNIQILDEHETSNGNH